MAQPKVDDEPQSSWRSNYPVHPCADVYPMMSDAELDALAQDIKVHGLQHSVVLWPGPSVPRKPTTYSVLDGRNRLEALSRAGVAIPSPEDPREMIDFPGGQLACVFIVANSPVHAAPQVQNPAEFVIGANIRRRHLTKEQQAELIVKTISAAPTTDRANVARSVARGHRGRLNGSKKDPVLAQSVTEAAKLGISKRTVQNARAKLQGKPKPTRRAGTSPPAPTTEQWAYLDEVQQRAAERKQRQSDHPEEFAADDIFDVLTYACDVVETWTAKTGMDVKPGTKTPADWELLRNRLTTLTGQVVRKLSEPVRPNSVRVPSARNPAKSKSKTK